MPLQNRVTPEGEIIATPDRGLMMGNRGGAFHQPDQTLRSARWASRQWICCVLSFKDRRRRLMQPNRYTELFFLDEATALAAGHRPCFECRRPDALQFARLWALAQGLSQRPSAPEMDIVLHRDRLGPGTQKAVVQAEIGSVPDGAFIQAKRGGPSYLVEGPLLLPWSSAGYGNPEPRPTTGLVCVLTPRSILAVLSAGYHPMLHSSASHTAT